MAAKSRRGTMKKLYRSNNDKIIAGVCGGLAEYFSLDVMWIRIFWILAFFMKGIGLFAYLVAVVVIPVNPNPGVRKEKAEKKTNWAVFWGSLLICIGLAVLIDRWNISRICFRWWDLSWKAMWPLGLVLIGIGSIFHARTQERNVKEREDRKGGKTTKRLVRSADHRMLAGVCGGIAQYLQTDPTLIRMGYVLLALVTNPTGWIIIYIALAVALPSEKFSSDSS